MYVSDIVVMSGKRRRSAALVGCSTVRQQGLHEAGRHFITLRTSCLNGINTQLAEQSSTGDNLRRGAPRRRRAPCERDNLAETTIRRAVFVLVLSAQFIHPSSETKIICVSQSERKSPSLCRELERICVLGARKNSHRTEEADLPGIPDLPRTPKCHEDESPSHSSSLEQDCGLEPSLPEVARKFS